MWFKFSRFIIFLQYTTSIYLQSENTPLTSLTSLRAFVTAETPYSCLLSWKRDSPTPNKKWIKSKWLYTKSIQKTLTLVISYLSRTHPGFLSDYPHRTVSVSVTTGYRENDVRWLAGQPLAPDGARLVDFCRHTEWVVFKYWFLVVRARSGAMENQRNVTYLLSLAFWSEIWPINTSHGSGDECEDVPILLRRWHLWWKKGESAQTVRSRTCVRINIKVREVQTGRTRKDEKKKREVVREHSLFGVRRWATVLARMGR